MKKTNLLYYMLVFVLLLNVSFNLFFDIIVVYLASAAKHARGFHKGIRIPFIFTDFEFAMPAVRFAWCFKRNNY